VHQPHVVAVVGSYRPGGTIDTLADAALEAARAEGAHVDKVLLVERSFGYCRNCFTCFRDAESAIGRCPQDDGMRELLERLFHADGILLASPVNCGTVTAVMQTFIECSTWTTCRPSGRFLGLEHLPRSRATRRRRAAVITSAGVIPWWLKPVFGLAERQLRGHAAGAFRADLVGSLFVGAVLGRALTDEELGRARALGRLLAAERLQPLEAVAARVRSALEPAAEIVSSLVWR
jgi:NAD(P)H-dependent FMN reductase